MNLGKIHVFDNKTNLNAILVRLYNKKVFPLRLQNRSTSAGLEPTQSHTEKKSVESYYSKYFTNI